ncbi:phosphotransferase [Actinopolymorpha sp. B11F2]|uniref:phosphotransferase n=1 Tax=Actinopolymorpha sp. B11F2 TaxID=3160862 RepID=UPI0032E4FEDA
MRTLPDNPSLYHLRRQAKDLLGGLRESEPGTSLSDAQSALAKQYGFRTWTDLKAEVDRNRGKADVADKTLAEAVAARYGLGKVTGPMRSVARPDNIGQRWSLETEQGRWTVRTMDNWTPITDAETDVALQEAAAAEGIRIPAPVRSRTGAIVESVGGHSWRVYEWVNSGPPLAGPVSSKDAYAVGEILAKVHRLAMPVDRISPWHARFLFRAQWPGLVAAAQARGVDWAPLLAKATPAMAEWETIGADFPVPAPVMCHNTLGPAKVWRGEGGRLIVVDWDYAGGQPPSWELCDALMHFVHTASGHRAMIDGYRAHAGSLPLLNLAMFRGALTSLANYIAEQVETALNAHGGEHQRHADRSVRHLLSGRLPSPDRLEQRLAAAVS